MGRQRGDQPVTLKSAPLVSVVTPVYNGEHHLRDCIESVLAQTYPNWDYTICNNCSPDRTLEIAQEYANKDPRIRIHNNDTFVHVNENHNIAFRSISPQSKYCKLVAADDWIFPECIERMVRVAEEHPSVAIVGSYGLCEAKVVFDGLPYPSTVVSGRELFRRSLHGFIWGGPYFFGGPSSMLYRSDIVRSRQAFFDVDNLHADSEVCFEFLQHLDFGFVHQVLTLTRERVRKNSMTSLSTTFKTELPSVLHLLVRYGPIYLSEEELKHMIRGLLRNYYGCLGEQVYRRHQRNFWEFHQKKLAELGYPLSKTRLAASAALFFLKFLVSPKRVVASVRRRLGRSLSSPTSEEAWSKAEVRGLVLPDG
jgi:glycosyltransferase involved in cell wall biosynthesis